MPVLATRDDLSRVSAPRPGGVASADLTGVGRGLASMGNSLAQAGAALKQGWEQANRAEVENRFQLFAFQERRQLDEMVQNTTPDQARGFTDTWSAGHKERVVAFLETVPDEYKAEYDTRTLQNYERMYVPTLTFERESQVTHQQNLFTNTLNEGIIPSASTEIAKVQEGPGADLQRRAIKRKWEADVAKAVEDLNLPAGAKPEVLKNSLTAFQLQLAKALPPEVLSELNPADWGVDKLEAVKAGMAQLEVAEPVSNDTIEAADQFLQANGVDPTPSNIALWHAVGGDGLLKLLNAAPDAPVGDVLSKKQLEQWGTVLGLAGDPLSMPTVSDVMAIAGGFMEGVRDVEWGREFDHLTPEQELALSADANKALITADNEKNKADKEAYDSQITELLKGIRLGEVGYSDILGLRDWFQENHFNQAMDLYDKVTKEGLNYRKALNKWQDPNAVWNQFNSDDRNALELLFENATDPAAMGIHMVQRTGFAPPQLTKAIRQGLVSTDAQQAETALQTGNNMMAFNPNVFAGQEGAVEIQNSVLAFRHYVDDLGYTAEDATARVLEMNSPEYRSNISAKIKDEDVDAIIKAELAIADLEKAFNDDGWFRPDIGFGPEVRAGMFGDYAELFRDRYLQHSNTSLAKKQAQAQLKRIWGNTSVNGSDVVMRYPPEKVAGMEALAGDDVPASEVIAAEALEIIRESTPPTLYTEGAYQAARESLRLLPIPGQTAPAYKAGLPTPYTLQWEDENGITDQLPIGQAFLVDPAELKQRQTAMREQKAMAARRLYEEEVQGRGVNVPLEITVDQFNPMPDRRKASQEILGPILDQLGGQ